MLSFLFITWVNMHFKEQAGDIRSMYKDGSCFSDGLFPVVGNHRSRTASQPHPSAGGAAM